MPDLHEDSEELSVQISMSLAEETDEEAVNAEPTTEIATEPSIVIDSSSFSNSPPDFKIKCHKKLT